MKNKFYISKMALRTVLFILLLSIAGMTKAQTENITFADAIVKAYCVANWDTDGDGELNQAEAAAVTSLDGVFMFDGDITSFNELQFFTGLTSFGEDEFNSCTSLASITIPSAVTSIGDYAFSDCSSLASITSYAFTPPTLGSNVFDNVPSTVVVNVPCGTSTSYRAAYGWSSFSNYEEFVFDLCPIIFADDNVKAICVAHWDTNGDGELSYAEAAAVTNLGTYFKSTAIISFEELEYFTSLTSLPNTAFYGCTSLASIALPSSVSALGNGSFYNCTNLATMTVYAETPPTVGTNAFKNVPTNMVVHIPCETYNAYHDFSDWSVFSLFDPCTASIVFNDANVKALCVANWDTNGNGELSYAEAAAVTDLGSVFKSNSNITSFNEFQYFIGLTFIGSFAFHNCYNLTSIIIPNSVTSIGQDAFLNCSRLTSIIIPNSVNTIGGSAFSNCSGLTSIEIPSSVTNIGSAIFYYCTRLQQISVNIENSVYDSRNNCNAIIKTSTNELITGCKNTVIPNSVTSIGINAFSGCTGLTSIDIPNSVTSIGNSAFSGCTGLTSIDIPNSVTSIGSSAFYNCYNLTSFVIPNSVTSIGSSTFYNCYYLSSIVIPNSVTSIGEAAFYGCNGLTSIDISNSVTEISNSTFSGCSSLTLLEIPSAVISIGNSAFYNCSSLSGMTILADNPPVLGTDVFYNVSKSILVSVPCGSLSVYQNSVGWNEFENYMPGTTCDSGEITIYANPTEGGTVSGAGYYEGGATCTLIATANEGYSFINWTKNGIQVSNSTSCSIIVAGNASYMANFAQGDFITFADANVKALCVANWDTDGDGELSYAEAAAVTDLGTVFKNKSNITNFYELQYFTGLFSIGDYAFYNCINLTSIVIPNSVTSIRQSAFQGCCGLTSLTIPNSVTSIGSSAFFSCTGLTSIEISNTVISIANSAFSYCSSLEQIIVDSENVVYDSRDNCNAIIKTSTNELILGCKNTIIPNSVTSIGNYAFENCSGLTSITIPNSVNTIGSYAFYHCSGLTSIEIPNSVTLIGNGAFSYCSNLFQIIVDLENTVYDSRGNCNAIIKTSTNELITGCKSTNIPNSVTSIGNYAFQGCSGLTSITIPNSVKTIGSYAFSHCSGLTSLVIPNSVTLLDWYVFEYCSGLTSLVIPHSVTLIDNGAFRNCSGLISVAIPNSVTLIGTSAFLYCSGLTSIEIPNSVICIGGSAFSNCSGLTSIVIPNSVTSIDNYAFNFCTGLTSMTVLAETPPSIGNWDVFRGVNKSIPVYVPCNSITAYQSATRWNEFTNYLPATDCDSGEITVIISPSEGGTVLGAGNYDGGATCTLIATANPAYTFMCWMEEGQVVSKDASYSFIVTGDRSFVAVFEPYYIINTSVNPNGGGTIYYDKMFDFENGFCGWTTIDADHDGRSWTMGSSVFPNAVVNGHNGSSDFVLSQSYINTGIVLYPDNYLVSPQVTLGGCITFYACAQDVTYASEHFGVAVSTTNNYNASAFTTIQEWTMTAKGVGAPTDVTRSGNRAQGNWYQFTVDLNAYEGQTGYVAIRHFNSVDWFCLDVDDITISRYSTNGREYYQGQTCFVTAVPNDGYDFLNWTENGEVVSSDAEYSFTVTENRNLVANFIAVVAEYYPDTNEPNSPYIKVHWTGSFEELMIGDTTSTINTAYMPFYTLYDNSISEALYTAAELIEAGATAGSITSLSWEAVSVTTNQPQNNISIWMANVLDTELTNTSHLASNMTLVYTGNIGIPPMGWNEFVFNESNFVWDGTSNVLILCQRNNGQWNGSVRWRSHDPGFYGMAYKYQDNTPYDVTSQTYTLYLSNTVRPNIIMKGEGAMTYNLYRANCDGTNAQLIAENLDDTQYIDETWWQLENNSYKYGVSIADSTNTNIFWSNCIEKQGDVVVQTITLSSGPNWFSTYLEITKEDLQNALLDVLSNPTGAIIKSQDGNSTYRGGRWRDQNFVWDVAKMYMIVAPEDCVITLTGEPINPADHPITIAPNVSTWIGFPFAESKTPAQVIPAGFAVNGDIIKGMGGNIRYNNGSWRAQGMNILEPGKGYIYNSKSAVSRTLVFPTSVK